MSASDSSDSARRVRDPRSCPAEVELPDVALHGELLPGWYEEWVLAERDRLRQLGLHGLEALAARLSQEGHHTAALDAALQAVNADPLRESAHRTVVRLHLAEGNTAEARNQYRVWCRLLRTQLGEQPSTEFARMVADVEPRLTNV